MKKEKSSLHLVELLAMIIIISIVMIIMVPGILNVIHKSKNDAYQKRLDMIKTSTRNYLNDSGDKIAWITKNDGAETIHIELSTLQKGGYADKKIIDPRNEKEITCAYTDVTRSKTKEITYRVTNCTNGQEKLK